MLFRVVTSAHDALVFNLVSIQEFESIGCILKDINPCSHVSRYHSFYYVQQFVFLICSASRKLHTLKSTLPLNTRLLT